MGVARALIAAPELGTLFGCDPRDHDRGQWIDDRDAGAGSEHGDQRRERLPGTQQVLNPYPAVAWESSRRPRRNFAQPSSGIRTTLEAVSATASGAALG